MAVASKTTSGVVGAVLVLGGLATGTAPALASQQADLAVAPVEDQAIGRQDAAKVSSDQVLGDFAFTQAEKTPTDAIARAMGGIAKYACGSAASAFGTEAGEQGSSRWLLTVGGAVGESYEATLEELAADGGSATFTMGCSCAGNPSDGLGSVNAEVTGVTIASLIDRAQMSDEANTIVFASSDGYEIALPLSYVQQRYSLIAFSVNGEPLGDSMGGMNQLWLGSTSARYFARDITDITLEVRQTPPPIPGTPEAADAYANVPNISVTEGVERR